MYCVPHPLSPRSAWIESVRNAEGPEPLRNCLSSLEAAIDASFLAPEFAASRSPAVVKGAWTANAHEAVAAFAAAAAAAATAAAAAAAGVKQESTAADDAMEVDRTAAAPVKQETTAADNAMEIDSTAAVAVKREEAAVVQDPVALLSSNQRGGSAEGDAEGGENTESGSPEREQTHNPQLDRNQPAAMETEPASASQPNHTALTTILTGSAAGLLLHTPIEVTPVSTLVWLPPTLASITLRLHVLDAALRYSGSGAVCGRDILAGYRYTLRPALPTDQHPTSTSAAPGSASKAAAAASGPRGAGGSSADQTGSSSVRQLVEGVTPSPGLVYGRTLSAQGRVVKQSKQFPALPPRIMAIVPRDLEIPGLQQIRSAVESALTRGPIRHTHIGWSVLAVPAGAAVLPGAVGGKAAAGKAGAGKGAGKNGKGGANAKSNASKAKARKSQLARDLEKDEDDEPPLPDDSDSDGYGDEGYGIGESGFIGVGSCADLYRVACSDFFAFCRLAHSISHHKV